MGSMNREERRKNRVKKLKERESLMKALGMQQGTLYKRHRDKVSKSLGYMSSGNVSHYVSTKPRKRYNRNEGNKYGIQSISEKDIET